MTALSYEQLAVEAAAHLRATGQEQYATVVDNLRQTLKSIGAEADNAHGRRRDLATHLSNIAYDVRRVLS